MSRLFDKKLFVMMLTIMIGTILVTFFVANILNNLEMLKVEEAHQEEIVTITSKNENFTSRFIDSTVLLDKAREKRASGDYNFDLALLWYTTALSEKNESRMTTYKSRGTANCTNAMPDYYNAHNNFLEANKYFNKTKSFTDFYKYIEIVDLYLDLTESGSKLTLLRYNATKYLKLLTENLTFNAENNNVTYLGNVTAMMGVFEEILEEYDIVLAEFVEIQEEIDEYEMFDEIR